MVGDKCMILLPVPAHTLATEERDARQVETVCPGAAEGHVGRNWGEERER